MDKEEIKIISQADLARLINKSKQQVHFIVTRFNCPFDTIEIGKKRFIKLTDKTKLWIENNKTSNN